MLATICERWRDVKQAVQKGNAFDPISGLMARARALSGCTEMARGLGAAAEAEAAAATPPGGN